MKIFYAALACVFIFTGALGPAHARKKKGPAVSANPTDSFWQNDMEEGSASAPYAVGMVSWYGGGFHGRKTASGERYNMHEMTCASRDLPFGTMLEVLNLANGERVVVRVNDRGPFVINRILDLSLAAAKRLGFIGSGSTRAELRITSAIETVAQR